MPRITIAFEVLCAKCGAGLCPGSGLDDKDLNAARLDVQPCTHCLSLAKDEAYDEAWDKGHARGLKEGADNDQG